MGVSRLLTTISCTQLPWWCIHLVHRNYTPKYCSKSYRWFFTPKVDETKNHISYGRSSSSLNMIQSQVLSHPQTTTTCDHHLHPASKGRVFSGSGRPMTWRISWVEKFWEKNDLQDADGVILITIYNLIIVKKYQSLNCPADLGYRENSYFWTLWRFIGLLEQVMIREDLALSETSPWYLKIPLFAYIVENVSSYSILKLPCAEMSDSKGLFWTSQHSFWMFIRIIPSSRCTRWTNPITFFCSLPAELSRSIAVSRCSADGVQPAFFLPGCVWQWRNTNKIANMEKLYINVYIYMYMCVRVTGHPAHW